MSRGSAFTEAAGVIQFEVLRYLISLNRDSEIDHIYVRE